jgi:hypothetical protein
MIGHFCQSRREKASLTPPIMSLAPGLSSTAFRPSDLESHRRSLPYETWVFLQFFPDAKPAHLQSSTSEDDPVVALRSIGLEWPRALQNATNHQRSHSCIRIMAFNIADIRNRPSSHECGLSPLVVFLYRSPHLNSLLKGRMTTSRWPNSRDLPRRTPAN